MRLGRQTVIARNLAIRSRRMQYRHDATLKIAATGHWGCNLSAPVQRLASAFKCQRIGCDVFGMSIAQIRKCELACSTGKPGLAGSLAQPPEWQTSRRCLGAGHFPLLGWSAVLLATIIGAAVAFGDEPAGNLAPVKFHIPAQSLVEALQAYSMQTGVQVMFETASASGYRSAPVDGELMPEVALRKLLADTDLRIRYSRTSAVTLAPASAPDPDEPPAHPLATADLALDTLRVSGTPEPSDHSRLGEYIGVVQADIQSALKKVAKTRRGDYRVAVRLWVDPSRTIQRAELDGSTGDRDRDSSIASALQGLLLSQQAPPNTPQPIRFMIAIRAL